MEIYIYSTRSWIPARVPFRVVRGEEGGGGITHRKEVPC